MPSSSSSPSPTALSSLSLLRTTTTLKRGLGYTQRIKSVPFSIITAQRCSSPKSLSSSFGLFSISSSTSSDNDKDSDTITSSKESTSHHHQQDRIEALHSKLTQNFNINATHLSQASHRSITSTQGYDDAFGKSAIKTYQSYLKSISSSKEDVEKASIRTARQIDFLIKQFKSQQASWIRHIDTKHSPRKSFPLMLVLDNVRSAFNVGSIFRTADACGVAMVITTGITPHPRGNGAQKVEKVALGADLVVPTMHFDRTMDVVDYLKGGEVMKEGGKWTLVGMETTERSLDYTSVTYPGGLYQVSSQIAAATTQNSENNDQTTNESRRKSIPTPTKEQGGTVLFLGNEVSGVDTNILPILDYVVEIPMFGMKNSLNVAACAPVVLYEILRQWGAMEKKKEGKDK